MGASCISSHHRAVYPFSEIRAAFDHLCRGAFANIVSRVRDVGPALRFADLENKLERTKRRLAKDWDAVAKASENSEDGERGSNRTFNLLTTGHS